MPVARGPQMNARSAILVGITGVMIAVVLGGGVLFLANQSENVELQLGDTDFDAGQIGRISEEIDDRGPILYSDVAGRSRDIRRTESPVCENVQSRSISSCSAI